MASDADPKVDRGAAVSRERLRRLRDANVAPYCSANPTITDDVVLFVLQIVEEAHLFYDRALAAFHVLARKDEVEFVSLEPCIAGDCDGSGARVTSLFGEDDWAKARADAAALMARMIRARTNQTWKQLIDALARLEPVLVQLAEALGLPPGTGRGMLRSLPRDEVLALHERMTWLPALEDLVRSLGRMKASDDPLAPTALERIGRAVERVVEVDRAVRGRRGRAVRGIERSGDIARMIPTEAAMLTHPVLRSLWRARWVERALLTYHAPGVLTTRVSEKQTYEDGEVDQHLRADRGPIQVIIDTSGSMVGGPETIAKAVVLQMLAVAHMEERRCYVYNFSGPGDLIEHELSFGGDGLARTLSFLSCSFDGGTDPDEALRRACKKLLSDEWRQADVVVVSDGEFIVGRPILNLIARTRRETAARFHGVLVGSGDGFEEVACDSLHHVSDWLREPCWAN